MVSKRLLSATLFLCVVGSPAASQAQSCYQPPQLVGTEVPYSLHGTCISFERIFPGMRVPLGAIVMVPAQESARAHDIIVELTVDRKYVSPQFVSDVFERPNSDTLAAQLLASRGIALTLGRSTMHVGVHGGVIIRLRSSNPRVTYQTFVGKPDFVVEKVTGDAYVAVDLATIDREFRDFSIEYRLRSREMSRELRPEGGVRIIEGPFEDADFPPFTRPRQIDGD